MARLEALAGNAPPECFFGRLPTQILADIVDTATSGELKEICKLSAVCKTFYSAVRDVKEVCFYLVKRRRNEMQLLRFLQQSKRVAHLLLDGASYGFPFPNAFLVAALGLAKSLRMLTMRAGSLMYPAASKESADDFFRTLSLCSTLHSFALMDFDLPVISKYVQAKCQLRNVHCLSVVDAVADEDKLASMIQLCPSLSHLYLLAIQGVHQLCIRSRTLVLLRWESCGLMFDRVEIDAPLLQSLTIGESLEAHINTPVLEKLFVTGPLRQLVIHQPWILRLLQVGGEDWRRDELLRLLRAAGEAAEVNLLLFNWQREYSLPMPREHLTSMKDVRQLTLSETMIQCLVGRSESMPHLELLEYLRIYLKDVGEEFPVCLQLVAISPKLRGFTICTDGGLSRKQVADCLELQRQYPKLRLDMKF